MWMQVSEDQKPNHNLGSFSSYKERYNSMKGRLKALLIENELFQDEVRRLQHELLDIYRDKETILEKVYQCEDVVSSGSDSESQLSDIKIKPARYGMFNCNNHIGNNNSDTTSYDIGLNAGSSMSGCSTKSIIQGVIATTSKPYVEVNNLPLLNQYPRQEDQGIANNHQNSQQQQQQMPSQQLHLQLQPQQPHLQLHLQAQQQPQLQLQQQMPPVQPQQLQIQLHQQPHQQQLPIQLQQPQQIQQQPPPTQQQQQQQQQQLQQQQLQIQLNPQAQQQQQQLQTKPLFEVVSSDGINNSKQTKPKPKLSRSRSRAAPKVNQEGQTKAPAPKRTPAPKTQKQPKQTARNSNNNKRSQSAAVAPQESQPQQQQQPPQQSQSMQQQPQQQPQVHLLQQQHHNQQQQPLQHQNQHQQTSIGDYHLSAEELEQHLEIRRMEQAALLLPDWEFSVPSDIFSTDAGNS